MEFNSESKVPIILFSPVEAINEELLPSLQEQAQSIAANQAIKLTVYQPEDNVKKEAVKFDVFDDTKEQNKFVVEGKEPLIIIKKYREGDKKNG